MNFIRALCLSIFGLLPLIGSNLSHAAVSANTEMRSGSIGAVGIPDGVEVRKGPIHPHAQLQHILAQPSFQQWRLRAQRPVAHGNQPLWRAISAQWDRLMKWLRHYFHAHKRRVSRSYHSSAGFPFAGFLEILAIVLGITLVAGIAMVLVRRQTNGKVPPASGDGLLSRDKIKQAMQQGDALAMASESWMRAARQFGSDGDFRAMYRAMYLSLLAGLHENGKIRFRRNHTNWRYVREFQGAKPERMLFGSLTDLFDHIWYGRKLYPDISPDALRTEIRSLIVKPDQKPAATIPGVFPVQREDGRA